MKTALLYILVISLNITMVEIVTTLDPTYWSQP